MGKTLIAYFSRKGANYVNGSIINLSVGNTEVAAKMAQEGSGLGGSERDIKRICKTANVEKGLAIHGGSVKSATGNIKFWLLYCHSQYSIYLSLRKNYLEMKNKNIKDF